MTENGYKNPNNDEQNDLMAEFRKLRSETTGIHSVFSEKSSIDVANFTGNKLLKNINDVCEKITEKQDDLKKEVLNQLQIVERKQIEQAEELCKIRNEVENIKAKQGEAPQELLKELRSMRRDLEETKQKIDFLTMKNSTDNPDPISDDSTDSLKFLKRKSDNTEFPAIEKDFVLRNIFKDVPSMKESEKYYSEEEEHFGIPWRMYIYRNDSSLAFFLNCAISSKNEKWSVEAKRELKLIGTNGTIQTRKGDIPFGNINSNTNGKSYGWEYYIEWEEMEKDYLANGTLIVEVHVTIKKTTGIYKEKLSNFDETMKKSSDVILIVEEKKFHVFKLLLAAQSTYFKSLLMENADSEVPINGVDPNDFQIFLEVLYREPAIDESSVETLLLLAERFDAQTVINQCEEFLIKISEKKLKKKLQLALKYNLENLKKDCFDKITSATDIRSVVPSELASIDPSIMTVLFEKTLSLLE